MSSPDFTRTADALVVTGSAAYVLTYALLVRDARRTRSYGMPLPALALNIAWEILYALILPLPALDRAAFAACLALNAAVAHSHLTHAPNELAHAPLLQKHIVPAFAGMLALALGGHYAFARWWLDSGIGAGVHGAGADIVALQFWSLMVCQVWISLGGLAQLVVRAHSGGVSYALWAARATGAGVGVYAHHVFRWWVQPEAHGYVAHPLGAFMLAVAAGADVVYPFVLAGIRRAEKVLPDGRRIPGGAQAMEVGYVVAGGAKKLA